MLSNVAVVGPGHVLPNEVFRDVSHTGEPVSSEWGIKEVDPYMAVLE